MIIVQLIGGLGNQMFQYAAGKRLAEQHQTELKLDTFFYKTQKQRKYELFHYNIDASPALWKEIRIYHNETIFRKLTNNLYSNFKQPYMQIVKEEFFNFDPHILQLPNNIYLQGFWQSERYFIDISETVRSNFSLKEPLSLESLQIEECIKNRHNTVSLHIRRGDYVYSESTYLKHGVCSLEYYHECIRHLENRIENMHIFVFSDEPDWAKHNLAFKHNTFFVEHNGEERSFEDMYLMSLCNHNIIANSTFSWWSAWLNTNSEKIIFAPQLWFHTTDLDSKDLIPEKWICI